VGLTGKAAREAQQRGEQLLKQINALTSAGGADEQHLSSQIAELNAAINQEQLPATLKAKLRDGIAELQESLRAIEKERSREASGQAVDFARQIADEATGPLIVRAIEA